MFHLWYLKIRLQILNVMRKKETKKMHAATATMFIFYIFELRVYGLREVILFLYKMVVEWTATGNVKQGWDAGVIPSGSVQFIKHWKR